jgi:predicted alpha/beta superfamily hydrolase
MNAFLKSVYIILLLLSCITPVVNSQQATFTVLVNTAYPLSSGEKVFIAGNQPSLGNWNASAVPLRKTEDGWTSTFTFATGTNLEYKFTKGSWDTEALTEHARVPGNHHFTLLRDTLIEYTIPFWKDSLLNIEPFISGNYQIHENFHLKGLTSRRVIVWLPPSYEKETSRRYPVLYVMDGQNVFDPYTSSLGYDWRIDEIADSLMRNGEIEEFIAVAIYSNADTRTNEYSDDPTLGEKYQDFMCCQLKPWIDSIYRTKTEAEETAVMGASMGGLIAFILAWEYPHVFGNAACMSPAFKVSLGNIKVDYIENVQSDPARNSIDPYIDNGTLDIESLLQPGIDEMLRALDQKKCLYTWYLDAGAPHNEIAWSARAWRPLKQFFGK